jgi:PAS domain S-box-containing protein
MKAAVSAKTVLSPGKNQTKSALQDALDIADTRFRLLCETTNTGILVMDSASGTIVEANPFLVQLLGTSMEELLQKTIWEVGFFKHLVGDSKQFLALRQEGRICFEDAVVETANRQRVNVEIIGKAYWTDKTRLIQYSVREILRQKKEETAFHADEIRMNALQHTNPDLIWLKDAGGVYLSCNIMFERFFGAPQADIIGKTDYDFIDVDLADFFRHNDLAAMAAGKPVSNEEWVTFAEDGRRVFLDTIKTPIFGVNGTFIGVLGTGRDITGRKKAEEALTQSETKFKSLFEGSNEAILLFRDDCFFDCNPKALELFGIKSKAVFKSLDFSDLSPDRQPDGRSSVEFANEKISQAHHLGMVQFDFTHRRYTGEEFSAKVHLSALDLGGERILQATIRDITQMEQELITTYKALLFQRVEQEKKAAELLSVYTELAFQYEEKEKRAAELVIACTELAIQNEENRKRAAELVIASTELVYQNQEKVMRAAELILAKAKAQENNRLKTAFLHNMSHEIRTPLNAILGFSSMLNDQDISKDDMKEFTDMIKLSGKRLLEIINNILDMSKLQTGQIEIEKRPMVLHTLFSEMASLFQPLAAEKNISLTFHNQDDLFYTLYTDAGKLQQVLANLINNALKFTKSGQVGFGFEIKDNFVQVYVRDTGIGIPSKLYAQIFNRFIQVEQSLTKNYDGAGLGLAISKGFVKLLGGKIWVESIVDKGTTFFFTLPYAPIADLSQGTGTVGAIPAKRIQVNRVGKLIMA